MSKISQEVLLKRAESEFLKGDYANALRSYGLILKDYPLLDEAKVGAFLSDLGGESAEEAQALFDYYQLIKMEKEDAAEIIDGLISSLDSSKQEVHSLLSDTFKENKELEEGIEYSDFLRLIENRGSFREVFEDIMFSSKVIITEKDEFIDFINRLTEEGFDEMALSYLDAASSLFDNDQEILALYNLLTGKEQ